MAVDVELFGQLLPGVQRRRTLSLDHSLSVRDVAILLGLDAAEVGLVVLNGVQSELDDLVPPDCRLCFFPPVSGG